MLWKLVYTRDGYRTVYRLPSTAEYRQFDPHRLPSTAYRFLGGIGRY